MNIEGIRVNVPGERVAELLRIQIESSHQMQVVLENMLNGKLSEDELISIKMNIKKCIWERLAIKDFIEHIGYDDAYLLTVADFVVLHSQPGVVSSKG